MLINEAFDFIFLSVGAQAMLTIHIYLGYRLTSLKSKLRINFSLNSKLLPTRNCIMETTFI